MKIKSFLIALTCASAMSLSASAATATITPIGLTVRRAPHVHSPEFERLLRQLGTKLELLHEQPGLIDVVASESTISEAVDDSGHDLLHVDGKPPAAIGVLPSIDPQKGAAIIDIQLPGVASGTARSISIKGQIRAVTAAAKDSIVNPNVRVQKGSELRWGNTTFAMVDVRERDGLEFSLSGAGDITAPIEVMLIDPNGQATQATSRGSQTIEINGERRTTLSFSAPAKGVVFDFKITFWRDVRAQTVDFATKVGIGLE
jgi:hypothetical protein